MIDWNSRWKDFLIGQGAAIDDSGVRHFAEPDAHAQSRLAAHGDIVADLSHLALISAHGVEAASFLQGQLSKYINALDAGHSQLSAYCNAKGRILALFRVFLRDGAYFLQLPAGVQPATLKRLKMFVLRAKLTLAGADRELIRIGVSGPNAARLLSPLLSILPERADESRQHAGITALRLPGPQPRFELIADVDTAQRLWSVLSAQATAVGASAWSWLDIAAGIPTVLPGATEEFIPHMVNLDLLGGVSFQKGCYPGQEIVARVHHLGRAKHRLYRAHVEGATPPFPGAPIYAALSDQAAGWVVDAQPAPAGGYDLSAVIALDQRAAPLHLGAPQGALLILQKPPYSEVVS